MGHPFILLINRAMFRNMSFFWSLKPKPLDDSELNLNQEVFPKGELSVKEELPEVVIQRLLKNKKVSILDGLNEYDEDYTFFESRGNIITHEMKKRLTDEILKQDQQAESENKNQDQDTNKLRAHNDQQSG